jgi:hypothetical protein
VVVFGVLLPNISRVNKDGKEFWRHAGIAFAIAIVFYIVFFSWMTHRREGKGPWQITFVADTNGTPSLDIQQQKLNLSKRITFDGAKIAPTNAVVRFYQGTTEIPFGKMLFQDPTFLPGTVTMEQFGHKVELLPRVLVIDKKEYAWTEPDLHLTAK